MGDGSRSDPSSCKAGFAFVPLSMHFSGCFLLLSFAVFLASVGRVISRSTMFNSGFLSQYGNWFQGFRSDMPFIASLR